MGDLKYGLLLGLREEGIILKNTEGDKNFCMSFIVEL